jgi:para-nitrobenzyl esterase
MNPRKPTVKTFRDQLAEIFGDQADAAAEVYTPASDAEAPAVAAALASDRFMGYTTWKWINVHAATGKAPVWRYRFDRVVPGDPLGEFGAAHASDIEYAFHTLSSKDANWQAGDRNASETMATAFANFIKTGNPNGAGVPTWPEFGETGKVMYLDASSHAGPAEFDERYEFLDTFVPD